MDEASCIYPNLSDVTQFELNKISKIMFRLFYCGNSRKRNNE